MFGPFISRPPQKVVIVRESYPNGQKTSNSGFIISNRPDIRSKTPSPKKLAGFIKHELPGGFKYFFIFTPLLREMIQFDEHIFQMGWNHQLVNRWLKRFGRFLDGSWKFSRPSNLRSAVPMPRSVRCKVDKREVYWELPQTDKNHSY